MDERWLLSRRALLGGLGATGVSTLLARAGARAQPIPTRFVFVHVPEGLWATAQRPLSGTTKLGPIFEPLRPYQSRVLVLNGLHMTSRDHGPGLDRHARAMGHMLTGTEMLNDTSAGGISLDQKIANAIGAASPIRSLHLAVRIVYGDMNGRPLWSAPGRPVAALQSPWDAYRLIFGASPGKTPFDLRRSTLDHALRDLASLRVTLAASDRLRLDAYQEGLRDVERRLTTIPPPTNPGCQPPTLGTQVDVRDERHYEQIGQLHMDLIVQALQCGVTRVATLQYGNSNDQCAYSFLGVNNLGHDLARNNNGCDPTGAKKTTVYQWYARQAAALMGKLEAIPEGSGTMLDNTLVLWASEFGDSYSHAADKLTWLLLGNAEGRFRSGRILDAMGRSTNDLHTSLCNAFGISDSSFGNPAYCAGPLPDLA
ncbi:MAG TPA: DUF1552 domain-containing protein [Polyangiales bacterium]